MITTLNIIFGIFGVIPTTYLLIRTYTRLRYTILQREYVIAYAFVILAWLLFAVNTFNLTLYILLWLFGLTPELIYLAGIRALIVELILIVASTIFIYIDVR